MYTQYTCTNLHVTIYVHTHTHLKIKILVDYVYRGVYFSVIKDCSLIFSKKEILWLLSEN